MLASQRPSRRLRTMVLLLLLLLSWVGRRVCKQMRMILGWWRTSCNKAPKCNTVEEEEAGEVGVGTGGDLLSIVYIHNKSCLYHIGLVHVMCNQLFSVSSSCMYFKHSSERSKIP